MKIIIVNGVAKNPPILSQTKNAFVHWWKSNTTERSQFNAQCAADGGFPGGYEMLCVRSEIRPVQSTTDSPARLQIVHIITLTLATDFGVNVGGCRAARVRGAVQSESLDFPYFVPAHVWVIGTLISSIWRCPHRRQRFASAPASQR